MKTGLVLEGGAMRGMFTCGIIDTFINNDIKFDGVVGVSAGAIFGVNYPSKQAGRVISYNLEYIKDKRYMGLDSLIKTGDLINKDFAYYTVPLKYYPFDFDTYHNSGIPFYACVTNMETGQPEYYQINDFDFGMEVLRASASMPFVTRPVMLNGKPCLDGGVADSIPFKFMLGKGYDRLVVVLTRDIDYVKKPMPPLPIKLKYRKYPAFAERLINRHIEYNKSIAQLKELEKEGTVFIIRPSVPLGIGRTERNIEKMKATYNRGLTDGAAILEQMKAFMASEG